MRTHPTCEFFIADSQVYYNSIPYVSGQINYGAPVPITSGYVSLYEMNVDRISSSLATDDAGGQAGGRWIGGQAETNTPTDYALDDSWVTGENSAGPWADPYSQWEYSSTAVNGLKGWWKMGAFQPDTTNVNDKAGDNTAVGSFQNAGIINGVGGDNNLFSNAVEFNNSGDSDGGTDNLNIGTAAVWDAIIGTGGTEKMTFAAWVWYAGTGTSLYPRIFQFGDARAPADGRGHIFAFVGTAGRIYFDVSGWDTTLGEWKTTNTPISSNAWHHVVITYDASSTSNVPVFYVDGVVVESEAVYSPAGSWDGIEDDDCFWGNRSGGDRGWQGYIVQASVWDTPLTSEDVRALYEASRCEVYDGRGGFIPSEIVDNGLIYPFVTKDGTRVSLGTTYTGSSYDLDFQYGDVVTASYPLSASITRELIGWYPVANGANVSFMPNNGPYGADETGGSRGAGQLDTGNADVIPTTVSEDTTSESSTLEKCSEATPIIPVDASTFDSTQDTAGGSTGWKLNPNDGFGDNIVCNAPKWPHYWALKNSLTNNSYLSEHYAVTSAYGIKDQQMINLISIPSIFYGSKIKPGSVSLKWFLTGTLIAELQDTKQNGELIEITTSNPHIEQYGANNVAGVVLYNEGFILLTGSWALNETDGHAAGTARSAAFYQRGQISIRSGSGNTHYPPMWIDWGAGANDNCNKLTTSNSGNIGAGTGTGVPSLVVSASNNLESASFGLSFKGTSETQVLTMFANAKRGEINYSNNPTFLIHTQSVTSSYVTSSYAYVEDPDRLVVNFVSSSYPDYSASFKRQVYISRVGIYDENKNLIGVATMSNPVRKEEDQDLTFKLKLDI
tara:strand:+ start:1030 stop:3552 length:2523 start_codon:yes stop_codon:yes gene_type:complete